MASSFHISIDGNPRPCAANSPDRCPFGIGSPMTKQDGLPNHYGDKAEAIRGSEAALEAAYGFGDASQQGNYFSQEGLDVLEKQWDDFEDKLNKARAGNPDKTARIDRELAKCRVSKTKIHMLRGMLDRDNTSPTMMDTERQILDMEVGAYQRANREVAKDESGFLGGRKAKKNQEALEDAL